VKESDGRERGDRESVKKSKNLDPGKENGRERGETERKSVREKERESRPRKKNV